MQGIIVLVVLEHNLANVLHVFLHAVQGSIFLDAVGPLLVHVKHVYANQGITYLDVGG
jgi:hypothetical protein